MNPPPPVALEAPRYDTTTVALHWFTAALVAALWGLAQIEEFIPKSGRHLLWSIHIALGAALIGVILVRLAWRTGRGVRLPPADAGMLGAVSRTVHLLLYVLIAIAVVLGIANTLVRGWDFGGILTIPSLAPDDRALRRTVNGWHELAANATLVLVALHAAAGLVHQYVLRDNVMRRMTIDRARQSE